MNGSFSFDATPMAPPGTEVLVHLKPSRRSSWSFHAANGWYIGPALKHYRCIRLIMADTGAERLTDTFRYKHHAMPVPTITPTDRIIAATKHLTDALAGTQEAPLDELQAILSLRQILLGETPPTPVPIDPPPAPKLSTPGSSHDLDDEPIHMWNPNQLSSLSYPSNNGTPIPPPPLTGSPAIIKDDVPPAPPVSRLPRTRAQHRATPVHLINSATTCPLNPINFIGAVVDDDTGDVLEYRHLIKSATHRAVWQRSFANELGRLFQGVRDVKGTNTCFFIAKTGVPSHKFATYGRIVCTFRPQKDEQHRTRLTVGGDRIAYAGDKSTPTADLVTAKLLINSTISTPKARFYGIDLANFYLMTPMPDFEYMRLRLDLIPEEIQVKYDLRNLVDTQGWVYIEIRMGMYGLPQAGILANKLLEKRLNAKGYYQCQHTPGLWRHVWRDIVFCLVVDDFGVKTTALEHITHLRSALKEHYTIVMDWDGSLFCGINIDWNYTASTTDLNMPKYIPKALLKFQHPTPDSPQHQPYKNAPIQ